MTKNTLRIVKTYDEPFDCEDCGTCYPEGLYIEFNGVVVWEKFSDGHYSGYQTEDSILNAMLNKWYQDKLIQYEYIKSEEQRLDWNKMYPGNIIAKTPESWIKYQNENFSYVQQIMDNIKNNCKNLPDEILQVKMIALWFESETGESFEVKVVEEKYKKQQKDIKIKKF
jgi:NTP pyrophosphatase (non-canonical NTP hydrolase)